MFPFIPHRSSIWHLERAAYSSYLKKFYERIKARLGAGKAIIATARIFQGSSLIWNPVRLQAGRGNDHDNT